jgi:hypothetical protein
MNTFEQSKLVMYASTASVETWQYIYLIPKFNGILILILDLTMAP